MIAITIPNKKKVSLEIKLQVFLISNTLLELFRNEGKILRKLMECLNTYLLRDGPNLGHQALEIHSAVKEIMFRCWLTSHVQGLKVACHNLLNLCGY